MLSVFELKFLTLKERARYVWDNGKYINSRSKGTSRINLYWLGAYYVEVIYNKNSNQVTDVVTKDIFHDN